MKILRAQVFERAGSKRYALPGQMGLDRAILRHLPDRPGSFLEMGANDGYTASNTYYLERFCGWRGILIEPVPSLFKRCCQLRPQSQVFNVACVDAGHEGDVVVEDIDLMSVVLGQQDERDESRRLAEGRQIANRRNGGRRTQVPTSTVSAIIDQSDFDRIDLMVIDVEGAEQKVLGGLDLDRHTPNHLLVETDSPDAITSILGARMRPKEQLTWHDYLYERS